jgi:hypothetical protein
MEAARTVLDQLWRRPVPRPLARDVRSAHEAADKIFATHKEEYDAMPNDLPSTVTSDQLATWEQTVVAANAGAQGELVTELGILSGQACTLTPRT